MDRLEQRLRAVYEEQGLEAMREVCDELLLVHDSSNIDKKKKVNGSVCEILLRVMTEEYLKKHRITGLTVRSLVLKNIDNRDSDFRTEIDFGLFTTRVALCAECKSFAGAKRVTDKCTLTSDRGVTADVYRQQLVHIKALSKHLSFFKKDPDTRALLMFCFVYARGTLRDLRSDDYKRSIPVITPETLYSYYDKVFAQFSTPVWQYTRIKRFMLQLSDSAVLHEQHKDYLGY